MLVNTVVIGAGVAGLSVACSLVSHRRSVMVFDRSGIGSGTTGMSAGTYCAPAMKETPASNVDDHLTIGTRLIFMRLLKNGRDIGLVECGAIEVATSMEQKNLLWHTYEELVKRGYHDEIRFVSEIDEIIKLEPAISTENLQAVLFYSAAGFVDPLLLVQAMKEQIEEKCAGAIVEDDEVLSVSPQFAHRPFLFRAISPEEDDLQPFHHLFEVQTKSGLCFFTRNVVVCGGIWTQNILERVMGITNVMGGNIGQVIIPVRAQGMFIRGLQLNRLVFYSEVYSLGIQYTHSPTTGKRLAHHTYGRPTKDDTEVAFFGFDRVPCTFADVVRNGSFMAPDLPTQAMENLTYLRNVLPQLSPNDLDVGSWVCYMPFAFDHEPIVGQIRPGVFILSGLGPRGIERGPQLADDLVTGIMCDGNLSSVAWEALDRFSVIRRR